VDFFKTLSHNNPVLTIKLEDGKLTGVQMIPSLCITNNPDYIRIWARNLPDKSEKLDTFKLYQYIQQKAKSCLSDMPLYCNRSKNRLQRITNSCYFWFKVGPTSQALLTETIPLAGKTITFSISNRSE
jgi:hypothetical protein